MNHKAAIIINRQTYVARTVINAVMEQNAAASDGTISIEQLAKVAYSFAGCDWTTERLTEVQAIIKEIYTP